jgi:hypothetical protein
VKETYAAISKQLTLSVSFQQYKLYVTAGIYKQKEKKQLPNGNRLEGTQHHFFETICYLGTVTKVTALQISFK